MTSTTDIRVGRANRPVPFQGTDEERAANQASHQFVYYGEEAECFNCFCKPWHTAASYPCGVEPPREDVPEQVAVADQQARFLGYATGASR